MRMLVPGIKTVLDYDKNSVYTLVMEDKAFYVKTVENFVRTFEGLDESVLLYNNEKNLSLSKEAVMIRDVFSLDVTCTKLTNALYNHLKQRVFSGELYNRFSELAKELYTFFDAVNEESDYSTEWRDDVDLPSLLKLAGFRLTLSENGSILARLLEYMHLYKDALGISLFVFVNSKNYFEKADLSEFYHECILGGFKVLNLEGVYNERVSEDENTIIIDRDFCEIY